MSQRLPPLERPASVTRSAYTPPASSDNGVPASRRSFMEMLTVPWVDRTIAIVVSVPFAIELYKRYTSAGLSFPRAILGLQFFLLVFFMVVRRPPKRVTPNPWFWLLAFSAAFGALAISAFGPPGRALVPWWLTNTLAVLSVTISIWARLNLGRNIGFVPAQRQIVSSGIYGFVRHPMYTGLFLAFIAFVLRSYSVWNLLAAAVVIALFMIKSIVEERFLAQDPEYADYLRRVRRRWIPGIA